MVDPPVNLSRLVRWTIALGELGIQVTTNILPYTTRCPLCRGSNFTVFHDTVCGGEWHHCSDCNTCGDMVELVAKTLKLNTRLTVEHLLSKMPAPNVCRLNDYHFHLYDAYVEQRHKASEFWRVISKRILSANGIRQLRLHLSLVSDLTADNWHSRGGQFIGLSTPDEFSAYYWRKGRRNPFLGIRGRMKSVDEMLIVPFYDLPGRISALHFIAIPNDDSPIIQRFLSALPSVAGVTDVDIAAGVAMLDCLYMPSPLASDAAVVLLDPTLAVRCHIKHLKLSTQPLPMVAVQPDAPADAILAYHATRRKLIFFAERPSPDLFRHARAANGYVVFNQPDAEATGDAIRRMSMTEWMSKLEGEARPWPQAMEEYVDGLSVIETAHLLSSVNWTHQEMTDFIDNSCLDVRNKVEQAVGSTNRITNLSGRTVTETPNGWLLKTGENICDAVIRIDTVIHNKQVDVIYYQGRIIFKGETIPFCAERDEFDKAPLKWVDAHLIKLSKGILSYNANFDRHAASIIKRFWPPKLVYSVSDYGWDEPNTRFVTPNYAIEMGGNVSEIKLPATTLKHVPAIDLPKPSAFTLTEWRALKKSKPDVMLVWKAAACILNNILAKTYHYQPSGISVIGSTLGILGELAIKMGCPAQSDVEKSRSLDKTNSWPIVHLAPIAANTNNSAVLLSSTPHNRILPLGYVMAEVMLLRGNWLNIESGAAMIRPEIFELAARVIPNFLQHMATRNMQRYESESLFPFDRVIADLAGWFKTNGINSRVIDQIDREIIRCNPSEQAEALWRVLRYFLDNACARFSRSYHIDDGGFVWLSKSELLSLFKSYNAAPLLIDTHTISRIMAEAGELVGEQVLNGKPGWVVTTETWKKRIGSTLNEI